MTILLKSCLGLEELDRSIRVASDVVLLHHDDKVVAVGADDAAEASMTLQ